MLKVYGIKNCDSCRKALKFLTEKKIEHRFIDLRDEPPGPGQVKAWLAIIGEQDLLNRRSTTWREMDDEVKVEPGVLSEQHLVALITAHPTLIKRPLFVDGARMMVGFDAQRLQQLLSDDNDDWDD